MLRMRMYSVSDVTQCQMYSVSDVMYEGILSVNPGIFVTLAASRSVTLCHLSRPRRARIRLIKMHNFAVLGPAIGQFH